MNYADERRVYLAEQALAGVTHHKDPIRCPGCGCKGTIFVKKQCSACYLRGAGHFLAIPERKPPKNVFTEETDPITPEHIAAEKLRIREEREVLHGPGEQEPYTPAIREYPSHLFADLS